MINLTPRDRLQYALKVQRLHEVLVLKDDIHLQYKYKNINRATTQAASFQDKIIDAVIEDAVSGTSDPISSSNIKNGVENIIDTNLKNDAKRISYGIPEKAVNAAVSNISNRYQFILGNRIREEIPNLQGKIEDYINTKNLGNLSEAELTQKLKAEYGEHAQKRIQNIIRDSFHTNECNLSWVKAVYDGYSYKIWNNGRTKRTRVWHKAKFIQSVPIDETFDIFGSYPARMMYPGDLNGGAENVANCRCWLSYTNKKPSDLRGTGKKTTTKTSRFSKSKTNNGLISKVKNTAKKPVNNLKSKLPKKSTKSSKVKNNGLISKVKNVINKPISYIKSKLMNNTPKSRGNRQIKIDDEIHSDEIFEFDEQDVKQKLRQELPKDISDDAIDYIINVLRKRGTAKFEYGQIFGHKSGKPESIEFGGYSNESVYIKKEGPYKNDLLMDDEEYINYQKNKEKYTINFVEGKTNLSIQHNHPSNGLHAPSTSDFIEIISKEWADYSFCISTKEIWVIEYKGPYSLSLRNRIVEDIYPKEKEAKSMKGKKSKKEINSWYGKEIEEYINTHENNINIYKVVL